MTEPRRPEPVISWQMRLGDRLAATRERVGRRPISAIRRDDAADPPSVRGGLDASSPPPAAPSILFTALLAIGSAALALSALWAWQAWSTRTSAPIDDLLPMLVASELDPADSDDATSTELGPELDLATSTALTPPSARAPGSAPEPTAVIVHVSGAVAIPGVVALDTPARVVDAVGAAGGATDRADLDRVNLAAPVVDGEHVHVPVVGEEIPIEIADVSPPSVGGRGGEEAPRAIDINRATATELEALPGIGPAIADAIVRTRDARGPFLAVEELLDVPGIGDAKLALLTPHVVVGG